MPAYLCFHHGVVPPEGPGGDEVCHHHIDAVVFVAEEDADESEDAQTKAEPTIPPHPGGAVCTQTDDFNKALLFFKRSNQDIFHLKK